ncbi:MAG: 3-methylornithine--L-lysine ligase PylC [Butyricicoccus sp.]
MIRLCVIGGMLQGTEICYLARKAGYETLLIDKNPACVAQNLATRFVCADVLRDELEPLMKQCDCIFPAVENDAVLHALSVLSEQCGVPLIHDEHAYHISSSKLISDRFFREHDIPVPRYYPEADFPLILKPSGESGSAGVRKINSAAEMPEWSENDVIQEYLEGPSYSIEVIGDGTRYYPLQITEIVTDGQYDCCRVNAKVKLSHQERWQMYQIANQLGAALGIKGIFDIETILCRGIMHVLEIDARVPSQTPTAVYHSTGINMVKLLYELSQGRLKRPVVQEKRFAIYQHIQVDNGEVTVHGEHIMTQAGPLVQIPDFLGCDEALTDYHSGSRHWRATLIATGASRAEAERKIQRAMEYSTRSDEYAGNHHHTDKQALRAG